MSGQPLTRVPGFFGKLPSRGDFVGRRLPADFVGPWDAWLQSAMAASRNALGSEWLDVYLTSPLWRFALSPGACGAAAHVGVVMPSVDNVGRYFPLTAAAPRDAQSAALAEAAALDDWYEAVEELLLETLAETPLDLEDFDGRLAELVVDGATQMTQAGGAAVRDTVAAPLRRHLRRTATDSLCGPLLGLCGDELGARAGPCSVWWTQGSERIEPCVLIAAGLPEPAAFVAMLDGRWSEHGWRCSDLRREAGRAGGTASAFSLRCAATTDVGKVRRVNEDAFARRDDAGMWLVADGLGGHRSGDVASRMVASALQQLDGGGGLTQRVERLVAALQVVNGCLRTLVQGDAAREGLVASTVAALLVENGRSACVWAGDSRVYRLRRGELRQLSVDHSETGDASGDNRSVTRAVGGGTSLELDVQRSDVREGDRFLLCTDGLYGEVAADQLAAALSSAEPEEACARLKQTALAGEARDNLTAVVVYVSRSGAAPAAG